MSGMPRMPLARARILADRFLENISDECMRVEVAGSVRRQCETVGDIEIVCVPNDEFSMGKLFPEGFPGMILSGPRLKRFQYPDKGLQIELYITTPEDWGRILAIRTGSSAYSHIALATQWNRVGWCGTNDGLRRKKECEKKGSTWKILPEFKDNPTKPPPFTTERRFFDVIRQKWIPPIERSWESRQNPEINYSL